MKWFPVISLASLVWLVSGCFDDSFGGAPSGREVTPDEPLPVFVEIGDPAELKGIGAVDNIALEYATEMVVLIPVSRIIYAPKLSTILERPVLTSCVLPKNSFE